MTCREPIERGRSDADMRRINRQLAASRTHPWGVDPNVYDGPGDPELPYDAIDFQQWLFSIGDPPGDCLIDGLVGANTRAKVDRYKGRHPFADAIIVLQPAAAPGPDLTPAPAPAEVPKGPTAAESGGFPWGALLGSLLVGGSVFAWWRSRRR